MFRILSGTLVNKNISSNVKQVKKVNLFLRQTFLFKNSGISRHKKKKKKRGGGQKKGRNWAHLMMEVSGSSKGDQATSTDVRDS